MLWGRLLNIKPHPVMNIFIHITSHVRLQAGKRCLDALFSITIKIKISSENWMLARNVVSLEVLSQIPNISLQGLLQIY